MIKSGHDPRIPDYLRKVHPNEVLPFEPRQHRGVPVIVIGASTGGTEIVHLLVRELPAELPPVCIVQHMPENFVDRFGDNLTRRSGRSVEVAADGQPLVSGGCYLLPGGYHGIPRESNGGLQMQLIDASPVSRHKPSVDILFRGAASSSGAAAACVLLTGMGDDGVVGMGDIRKNGGYCIIQSRETCVVFGMPGVAAGYGLPHRELAPAAIVEALVAWNRSGQRFRETGRVTH